MNAMKKLFIEKSKSRCDFIPILLLLFASCAVYTPYNKIGLWVIMPSLFVFFVFKGPAFKTNNNTIIYLSIILCSFISCLIAENKEVAFESFAYILTGFVGFSIFYMMSINTKNIKYLFLMFIVYYACMWLYIKSTIGVAGIDIVKQRLGVDEGQLNANDVAYMTFYFNAAVWMLYSLSKKTSNRKVLGIFLLIGMMILSFVAALLFASRQILLIEIPFLLGLLYIKYVKNKTSGRFVKWILPLFVICAIVLLYLKVGKEVFENSLLFTRYEDVGEDSRFFLMQKALEVGFSNPILGVGCGNFMYYSGLSVFSHCSYTEMFANSGLLAVCLYLSWILGVVFTQIKRYRRTGSVIFLYLALISFMWFISNFFFVYYINVWLMGFWGLLTGASDALFKREIKEKLLCESQKLSTY